MNEKGRIEVRSNGQPRAAVHSFFVWLAVVFVICGVVIGGAKAQSGAGSQAAAPAAKTAVLAVQEYSGAERHPGGSVDSGDAVHYRVAGGGVRVLPRAGGVRKGRQEAEGDCTEDDGDDVHHQPGEFRRESRSDLLFVPSGQHQSGGDAGGDDGRFEAGMARRRNPTKRRRRKLPGRAPISCLTNM
jgi:hypothetical protein